MVFSRRCAMCFLICVFFVAVVSAGGRHDNSSAERPVEQPPLDVEDEVVQQFSEEIEENDGNVSSTNDVVVRVAALNGPSGIPMAYLFENPPEMEDATMLFETEASADVLLPKLLKGDIDIGVLPPNVAAKVYNRNNGALVVGAVVGQGMLCLVTRDETVNSFSDLRGKTVNVAGQGATPEYMFRYLLSRNGIEVAQDGAKPEDWNVVLDFSVPTAEIAVALLSGKIQYAVLPEPFATLVLSKDQGMRRAIDFQSEYAAVEAADGTTNYPMTVVVIRADFAHDHPELVRRFLSEYELAVAWTIANPSKAGVLVQKHTLGLLAPIAARVIPNASYVFQPAYVARPQLEKLFSVFMDFAPESVGGVLPDDGFYFE